MKRYLIQHETIYNYPSAVELFPHTLRLRPREGHDLRIETSALRITPPATLRWQRDAEGNTVAIATFDDLTRCLNISTEIVVQQYDHEPLDFLVAPYALYFPFQYQDQDRQILSVYRNSFQPPEDSLLGRLVQPFRHRTMIQNFTLLNELNSDIHQRITYQKREQEGVQSAEQTLSLASGSCRDIAHLFIVAARILGYAARFVSGYVYNGGEGATRGDTHAWAEIFLPGAGWKGFDPTYDSITGIEHIAVSVAYTPTNVPPVSGSFRGDCQSHLSVAVLVELLD